MDVEHCIELGAVTELSCLDANELDETQLVAVYGCVLYMRMGTVISDYEGRVRVRITYLSESSLGFLTLLSNSSGLLLDAPRVKLYVWLGKPMEARMVLPSIDSI